MQGFLQRFALVIVALLGGAHCAPADAGTITFDFSGTFSLYNCFGCQPNDLESLLGTSFSGSVSVPDSAAEAIAVNVADPSPTGTESFDAHSVRATYGFAPGRARFRLDTALDVYDFDGSLEPVVMVQDCAGQGCPGKDDFLWVFVQTPSVFTALYISGVGQFEGVDIPPFALLKSLTGFMYFDVETPDNLAFVGVGTALPSPLQVTVTSDVSTVPLPGGLTFLACGLVAAVRRARRAT